MKLLLVEDDILLARSIQNSLKEGFTVAIATRADEGLFSANNFTFDLLIIDIGLPDSNGIALCREIRKNDRHTPLLILTGNSELHTKILAFEEGADDYLTKPFSKEELLVRIQALLRRVDKRVSLDSITFGDFYIHFSRRTVSYHGEFIHLRKKEFDIFVYLARNVGKVISREELQVYIWGEEAELSGNTIDVHINYLRDKIDKPYSSDLIQTVHGVGYRLRDIYSTS